MIFVYVVGSFLSFLGVILLIIAFKNDFKNLNSTQKLGIILTSVGVLIPFLMGTINGIINN